MKSKAHTKNYAASGSGSSTQQSGTQSSESDTEDSGMDSSGELMLGIFSFYIQALFVVCLKV